MPGQDITQLKRIVSGYREFSTTKILKVELLDHQGYSSTSYHLRTDDEQYIVKLYKDRDIGVEQEYEIQISAYLANLAPEPVLLDKQRGILISKYIHGEHRSSLSTDNIKALAATLFELHSMLPQTVEQTILQVDTNSIEKFIQEPALCHNDPNPKNIIWKQERPILIDWEYSGINDRYFDLASVIVEFRLSVEERRLFLNKYFHDASAINMKKLGAYIALYQDVCRQWWSHKKRRFNI